MGNKEERKENMLEGKELFDYVAEILGGRDKLHMMIDLCGTSYSKNSAVFMFRAKAKKKINLVEITYNVGSDSFKIKFMNYSNLNYTIIEIYDEVYVDQLKYLFEETTGLYLSF